MGVCSLMRASFGALDLPFFESELLVVKGRPYDDVKVWE